ncbi:hypothetical protein TRFO_02499 [Tritrichomonas foetus]|uniref:IPT/TIG domain-containing protein n=1 Tax=Tritrichomonas foetus TaxID=1144522 RepID=A0A1J4L6A3_9EUKA|nr:hypothetical protein TRFO_02499 [Tritrichomonas foetus]|eukprot:OHT17478.1 hypothetical protein TRFO_02499 [Tritrichomonas foetus]
MAYSINLEMLFIYCLLGFVFSAKENSLTNCTNPNTVLDWMNKCVCIDGYPHGDPNSPEGCFKCEETCHFYAKCIFPGKCDCIDPYKGDGVLKCEVEIPHLISISPDSGSTDGGTLVNISYTYQNAPQPKKYAYIKFGALIVHSDEVTSNYITCRAPARQSHSVVVSISFDTIGWSKEEVFFKYQNPMQHINAKSKNKGFLTITIFCLLMLVGLFIASLKQSSSFELPYALANVSHKSNNDDYTIPRRRMND